MTVANKVRDHGKGFEKVLREREKGKPKFGFLENDTLPSYHYFKMLLDRDYEPPAVATFDDDGNHSIYSSDSSEDSEQERLGKGKLGKLAQRRFESLLRGLTSTRDKIAKGMAFALEHADCAAFIADLLVCSLTIDTTPVPRKLARLHLISDILHNASASLPNAWVYRSIFEKRLGKVFDHLGDVYLSFPGRMKAEQFRGMVEKVIDVWDKEWLVFEPTVIEDFKRRLSGVDSVLPGEEVAGGNDEANVDPDVPDSTTRNEFVASRRGEERHEPVVPQDETPSEPEDEKKSFGAFKMSFKAAAFKPALSSGSTSAPAKSATRVEEVVHEVEGHDGAAVDLGEDVDGAEVDVDGADVDGDALDDDMDGEAVDGEAVEMEMDVEGQEAASGDDIFK